MSSEVPKTALNPKHRPGQGNPAHQKAKMVAQVLQKRGLTQDANNKKAATQNLIPFIEKMDPSDALVMTADDIADQFAAKFFQKH